MRVDLELAALHRNLRRSRHIAAETHDLGKAPMNAFGRLQVSQPMPLAAASSTARCRGWFAIQPAAEGQRVLPCRVGQLIQEAFEIDRILVEVHPAPRPGRTWGFRMAWSISRLGKV